MNKLIKLSETHYIVVDDSEIKEGSWVINGNSKIFQYTKESISGINYCKKITHSTEPIERYDHPAGGYEGTFDKIKPLSLSEVEEAINGYSVEKMAEDKYGSGKSLSTISFREGYIKGFKAHQELFQYSRNQVHDLMTKAFKAGFKKHNVVEAGLEPLESDVECSWILTKFDSTPKLTEWEVEFDEQGKLRLI